MPQHAHILALYSSTLPALEPAIGETLTNAQVAGRTEQYNRDCPGISGNSHTEFHQLWSPPQDEILRQSLLVYKSALESNAVHTSRMTTGEYPSIVRTTHLFFRRPLKRPPSSVRSPGRTKIDGVHTK
ncbi:hypothetical protein IF1G_01684 [Cordyceps javanica]|uniref:Uncharacterized protein n=1 Tax=Cordyceps javanica TaxID=43265 RepID=A0A545WA27_9HYPO|nr:hypothetical protein IF1G_01684 [Cordyceps javanica]TQW10853.1 hypothetical protein IF2G_01795 [Cordyceps javanica]